MTIQIEIWDVIRATFGAGIVSANWGVYRGVALEESSVLWEMETGRRLLLRSLFAETLLALALLGIDSAIFIQQRTEIISLQKRLAARVLSDAQLAEMKQELAKFPRQQFLFDAYAVKEASDIGKQISDVLVSARWQKFIQPPNAFLKSIVAGVAIFVPKHLRQHRPRRDPRKEKLVEVIAS